jgi:hypothetical protein
MRTGVEMELFAQREVTPFRMSIIHCCPLSPSASDPRPGSHRLASWKKERIASGNVDARFQGPSTSIYSAFPVFVKTDSAIRYRQKQNLSRWAKDPLM